MKKSLAFMLVAALSIPFAFELSAKKVKPATEYSRNNERALEGDKVVVENVKLQGIEMAEALSDDGMEIVKIPYRWYAGIATSTDKQMAVEMAQREAYATISRTLNNAVIDGADKGGISNNEKVMKALTSHWEQISSSLQKGCEPFGNTTIEYNKKTGVYTATAKVGIRGDKYAQMLNQEENFRPADLSGDDLKEFVEINKSILDAAKGI